MSVIRSAYGLTERTRKRTIASLGNGSSPRGATNAVVRVTFTENLQRHVACPPSAVGGKTVREVLDAVFSTNQRVRGYVLDDQGALRKHMIVFVNGRAVGDRTRLSDDVPDDAEVYIMQALSGG